MKKLIVASVIATTATAASAFDYKFNLEGRADFVNANIKTTTAAGVATTEKYNNFSNGLIRLNLLGSINENLTYRFRYRFISAGANPASTNTTSPTLREISTTGVDYFYIDHKNSLFTTRLGKQNWNGYAYGREGIVSGTDVFLTSQAATTYKTAFGSDYRYGVTAMFKFLETNTFDVAISNPNTTISDQGATNATSPEKKNTGLAYGAFYTGNFFSKLFQPILAFQVAKQNGDTDATAATRTKDVTYTMWNAGLRTEFMGLVVDADYKMLKTPNRNDGTNTTAAVLEKTKSIYANVAYAIGDFTPLFTYINDKFDSQTATANYKRNSFAIGTYYRPMADVNFRYHLMFTSAQKKADGATSTVAKVDDKKIYLGFKADI